MAVVHETGTATDPVDLLDKLRIFCVAQASITVDQYLVDPGEAGRQLLSISFGSGFYSIAYDTTPPEISADGTPSYLITQHTSFVAALNFGNQANETEITTNATTCNLVDDAAISVYHFFYNPGGMLYVCFQVNSGLWRQFGVGDIEKFGTYTGGSLIMGNFIATATSNIENPYQAARS